MKSIFRLTLFLMTLLATAALPAGASADTVITVGGKEYIPGGSCILLDRENIFQNPHAINDPVEAFRLVNQQKGDVVLLVAPSVYWLDNPDDPEIRTDRSGTPFAVKLKCNNLTIIGLSDNPEDVVFAVNRGQTQGAIGNYTMFEYSGTDLAVSNITFGNYCNTDLEYPRNPKMNRLRRKDAIVQAQIGICKNTERLSAENCRFISRLNLCPFVGARRSLFDNCYFECTDDALSGSAVYKDCRFTFFSSKPFYSTDLTGAVFLNCDIHSQCHGTQYFTKIPGQIAIIDTRFTSNSPIIIKWTRDASDIVSFQHNVTLNGMPYTIDAERPALSTILDGLPLIDAYKINHDGKTIYNIPNLLNGNDGWDPLHMNGTVADMEQKSGRKLTGIPVTLNMTTTRDELQAFGDTAVITATPLLWGGYKSHTPECICFTSDNKEPNEKRTTVSHSIPSGLSGSQTIVMRPNLRMPPKFSKAPKILFDYDKKEYTVDYRLSGKGSDESAIIWSRICREEDGTARAIAIKSGIGEKGRHYSPTAGDAGYEIAAAVTPKYADSHAGEIKVSPVMEMCDPDAISQMPETSLSTDFSDIPVAERMPGIPGAWSFDIFKPKDTSHIEWEANQGPGWYYGKGFDASTGTGLVQSEKGARLSYIPARDVCRDMTVCLTAEPAKSGGQGFGSATTQYMDICVKFDPVSLNGYALRIERTPDYDKAVRFSLIRYTDGITKVIDEGVASDCFRTPCTINVGITDGRLFATASTGADNTDRQRGDDIAEEVSLSVPVEDSGLTGFCIQHTGSVGTSSTLIRDVALNWK